MKVSELSQELIGKLVSCVCNGERGNGVITDLIAYDNKGNKCSFEDPEACSKGVSIKLAKPVYNHVGSAAFGTECEWYQKVLESTCPVMPQSFRDILLKDGEEYMKKVEESLYSRAGNLGLTYLVEEGGSNE